MTGDANGKSGAGRSSGSDSPGSSAAWRDTTRRGGRRFVEEMKQRLFGHSELHRKIDHLTELVQKVVAKQKQDERWRIVFRRQMNAMLRGLYLADGEVPAPYAMSARRFRLRSQNEEDGIILTLLKAARVSSRRFLEIGCGSTGGNSAILAYEFGWAGLMIDASKKAVARLQDELKANPHVTVVRAKVAPETINDLLRSHGMEGEIDFMSIDIDSIDYWVLEALEAVSPRVLVTEYNALFGPERAVTLPKELPPGPLPKGYSGASLVALEKLARRKGYRLVLCEEAGVNAFFVRDDVAPDVEGLTPGQAYRPLRDRMDLEGTRARDLDVYRLIEEKGLPLVEV